MAQIAKHRSKDSWNGNNSRNRNIEIPHVTFALYPRERTWNILGTGGCDRLNNFTRLVGESVVTEVVSNTFCIVASNRKKPDERACLINFTWRQVYTPWNPYGDWLESRNKSPPPVWNRPLTSRLIPDAGIPPSLNPFRLWRSRWRKKKYFLEDGDQSILPFSPRFLLQLSCKNIYNNEIFSRGILRMYSRC